MPKFLSLKVLVWLILALIWGTTWIFIKIGDAELPPVAFAGARFILSVAILFVLMKVQGITLPRTATVGSFLTLRGQLAGGESGTVSIEGATIRPRWRLHWNCIIERNGRGRESKLRDFPPRF